MLLHVDARLYHALGLGYNNAAGICGNLYFTCEEIKGKKRWMSHQKIWEKIAQTKAAVSGLDGIYLDLKRRVLPGPVKTKKCPESPADPECFRIPYMYKF